MNDINLMTWFAQRQLDFCPKHFVRCQTYLTDEARLWVYEYLTGRFYITTGVSDDWGLDTEIFFENPQEAMLYELKFS